MPEESTPKDLGSVWREQPEEKLTVTLEQFVNRRTEDLRSHTRSEIQMSIGAAVFFIAVIGWRFASGGERLPQLIFAAATVWILISLYWFRKRIRQNTRGADAFAATGLEHYRKELELRRDHLRNLWLWHGPPFLACMTLAATVIGKAFPGVERLRSVLPLVFLLALWTAYGIIRRRRQANEIQSEIDQL